MAMSEKDKKTVMYGVPAVVILAILWFCTPWLTNEDNYWDKYNNMGKEIEKKDGELREALLQQQNLDMLQERVAMMEAELVIAKELLPSEEDVKGLLQKIPELALAAGIQEEEIQSIGFGSKNSHEQYYEWPISISFREIEFSQMVNMLYGFEEFERLLDVTNLPISVIDPKENTIQLSMTINVYVLREFTSTGEEGVESE